MAKIYVRQIDGAQTGSYKKRRSFFRAADRLMQVKELAKRDKDGVLPPDAFKEMDDAYQAIEDILRPFLSVDPGEDLDAVLEELSEDEFFGLIKLVGSEANDEDAVPPTSDTD